MTNILLLEDIRNKQYYYSYEDNLYDVNLWRINHYYIRDIIRNSTLKIDLESLLKSSLTSTPFSLFLNGIHTLASTDNGQLIIRNDDTKILPLYNYKITYNDKANLFPNVLIPDINQIKPGVYDRLPILNLPEKDPIIEEELRGLAINRLSLAQLARPIIFQNFIELMSQPIVQNYYPELTLLNPKPISREKFLLLNATDKGFNTYYIPLNKENCDYIQFLIDKHVAFIANFIFWLWELGRKVPIYQKYIDIIAKFNPHVDIDIIHELILGIIHISGVVISYQDLINLLMNIPEIPINAFLEVLHFYRRNIKIKCFDDNSCNAGLICAITPQNYLAGMVWVHDNDKMRFKDGTYITQIGITSTITYWLARRLVSNLPSLPSMVIPNVVIYAKSRNVRRIMVKPTEFMEDILIKSYGFRQIELYSIINVIFLDQLRFSPEKFFQDKYGNHLFKSVLEGKIPYRQTDDMGNLCTIDYPIYNLFGCGETEYLGGGVYSLDKLLMLDVLD